MSTSEISAPPRFLVLEGIDGSGTTTQRDRLSASLRARGHIVHATREPSDGEIGKLTRALLAVEEGQTRSVDAAGLALLFAADRLEHLQREIVPALDRGEVVLCDRYLVSSWVYQSLDCDPGWVRDINRHALWPELTFMFELAPEIALARVAARRESSGEAVERFDVPETQRRLARGYAEVLTRVDPAAQPGLVRIDAAQSIDAVTAALLDHCVRAGL